MGNRLAKPPPLNRPYSPLKAGNSALAKPFPVLTPQSYLPGAAGAIGPGYPAPGAGNKFPTLGPNSYLPQRGNLDPPVINPMAGAAAYPPPLPSFPSMMQPPMHMAPPAPPPMTGMMSMMSAPQPSFYDPGLCSYPRRRPVRICRRRRRSRRCRPVIHIVESSSCSSLSSCTTISSCSRRRHRSRSHSRHARTPPQQPIILLPIQCQQPAPAQSQIQSAPQQIMLPPIQIQQPGQGPQQLALPPIPIQQLGQVSQQLALPPVSIQQQSTGLSPIQLNSSGIFKTGSSNPIIIPSGQQFLQTSTSLPQITTIAQPQQIQSGAIQYVQAVAPRDSSPLQYISREPRSSNAQQRSIVNSANKTKSSKLKTLRTSSSFRDVPQTDVKSGRRPFDWYQANKKSNIINDKIQIGQKGHTIVH